MGARSIGERSHAARLPMSFPKAIHHPLALALSRVRYILCPFMKVLVTGSSGFVGSALVPALSEAGHSVRRLVRDRDQVRPGAFFWDPTRNQLDSAALTDLDAVVHLAGDNIAVGRWTQARKRALRESRVVGTKLLANAIAGCAKPPGVFVSASAIGFYGDRGSEWLDEESSPGTGFLPTVCAEWEAASDPVATARIRRVILRFGIILAPCGGALAKMLTPFRLGLGGVIGSGNQFMSWITLEDVVGVIRHVTDRPSLQGVVNAVSPQPVTNREFTQRLASAVHRPAFLPLPAFAARLAFGEMADAALLASARVKPGRLLQSGYPFRHSQLEPSLAEMLRSAKPRKP